MAIPFSYTTKNLVARKLTTVLTTIGMALVVFVFATVLMLSEGLEETLVETGRYDNVMVIRQGSETEIQSAVDREQAAVIESQPQVAFGVYGTRLISKELVVLVVLMKKHNHSPANVTVRGLLQSGQDIRPRINIIEGRMFRPGSTEIIVGSKIAKGFENAHVGGVIRLGLHEWTVVGIFDAGNTGFASELWGDVDQLMQAFRRVSYSSIIFSLENSSDFTSVKKALEDDPRLTVEVKRESVFYAEQSEMMANFLRILGLTLSIIFSVGATIGAMITMYASVASRTREIGTLRALGFGRGSILLSFLFESLLLGFCGGLIGLLAASTMQFMSISTMNWQTFSELAFRFTLTHDIVIKSLAFALLMGFLGGFLPAGRAAKMSIIDALRAD